MNILIVSSSENIALTLLGLLSVQGHRGHVLNIWRSAEHARLSRYCSGYRTHILRNLSSAESQPFLLTLQEYCRQHAIEMILPAGLWGTVAVASLKAQLPVAYVYPTASPDQIYRLHNKWHFYQDLAALGIPVPETRLVTCLAIKQLNPSRFPVIIKPVTRGGSVGVQACPSLQCLASYQPAHAEEALLVQERIAGVDAVFGAYAIDGALRAWTLHKQQPDFVEFYEDERIVADVRRILRATGFTGACNFDLRVNEDLDCYKFLECNPRFWGSVGVSAWYGVDIVTIGMLTAQNKPLTPEMRVSVVGPMTLPNPDVVRYFRGVLRGQFALQVDSKSLPWRLLMDPLPLLVERARRQEMTAVIDDTRVVDKIFGATAAISGSPAGQGRPYAV